MRRSIFGNAGVRHFTQTFASGTEPDDEAWHLQPSGARTDPTTSSMMIGESPEIGAVVRQIGRAVTRSSSFWVKPDRARNSRHGRSIARALVLRDLSSRSIAAPCLTA